MYVFMPKTVPKYFLLIDFACSKSGQFGLTSPNLPAWHFELMGWWGEMGGCQPGSGLVKLTWITGSWKSRYVHITQLMTTYTWMLRRTFLVHHTYLVTVSGSSPAIYWQWLFQPFRPCHEAAGSTSMPSAGWCRHRDGKLPPPCPILLQMTGSFYSFGLNTHSAPCADVSNKKEYGNGREV